MDQHWRATSKATRPQVRLYQYQNLDHALGSLQRSPRGTKFCQGPKHCALTLPRRQIRPLNCQAKRMLIRALVHDVL
jgi:hypothetical protein